MNSKICSPLFECCFSDFGCPVTGSGSDIPAVRIAETDGRRSDRIEGGGCCGPFSIGCIAVLELFLCPCNSVLQQLRPQVATAFDLGEITAHTFAFVMLRMTTTQVDELSAFRGFLSRMPPIMELSRSAPAMGNPFKKRSTIDRVQAVPKNCRI